MLKIAITGNIGSGKSLLTSFVKKLGGVTASCDDMNRELLREKSYLKKLSILFPNAVINGVVDKKIIREEVFSSKEKLQLLNDLAHPAIKKKIDKFFRDNKDCNCVYVEVPLLFETGMEKLFDRIWFVTSSEENAVLRAVERDGVSKEQINSIRKSQAKFKRVESKVNEIFINDKSKEDLFKKVKEKYIPSHLKQYTHLFIDLDNTILDFNKSEEAALKLACKDFGISVNKRDVKVYNEMNRREWERFECGEIEKKDVLVNRYVNFLAYKKAQGDASQLNELYKKYLAMQAFYIKGAKEGIKKLKQKYVLCLISNGTYPVQKGRLELSGLDKVFDYIVISDEIGLAKPNKEYFDYCLKLTGVNKENVLVIGDSNTSDMKGAFGSGLDALYYVFYGDPCLYPCIASVSNWKELLKLLV